MNDHLINIIAKGMDEASGPLGNVGGALSGLGGIASGVATGGLALVAAGLAGIVAGGIVAAKAVWDFSRDTDEAMKLFSAQTGIAGDELADMKEIAKDVWAEGFGDSIGDVVDDMSLVHRAFDLTGEDLEAATKRAMTLSDVFGIDVAESTMVASSMMKSWNISEQEAFDTLAKGSQMGLDRMGDLADTLHEYSGDFDNLGFTADQTLSILNAGLEAGAYNTDVVADGFREMGIRLMEGGEDMSEVFAGMGLDFEAMQASVAAGDETWGDYSSTIVQGLMDIDDEVERNAAGVEIFGTKWEDLGGDVFLAAGMATEGIEGITGATDEMADTMATGIGPAFERLKRGAIENLAPLGDYAGEMLNKMTPFLEKATEWLGENIPKAIGWLEEKWTEWWPIAQKALTDFWTAIQPGLIWIKDTFIRFYEEYLPRLREAWDILKEGFGPIVDIWNNNLKPAFAELKEALGFSTEGSEDMGGAMGILGGEFVKFLTEGLVTGLTAGVQLLTIAFIAAKDAVGWIHGKMEGFERTMMSVKGHIQAVRDWMDRLKDSIGRISLPDWLTPGSPTPFENALRGIIDALSVMPDLTVALRVPQMNLATALSATMPQAGRGGGGVNYTIYNQFGKDSIRDDEDVLLVGDAIREALEHRGVQPAL